LGFEALSSAAFSMASEPTLQQRRFRQRRSSAQQHIDVALPFLHQQIIEPTHMRFADEDLRYATSTARGEGKGSLNGGVALQPAFGERGLLPLEKLLRFHARRATPVGPDDHRCIVVAGHDLRSSLKHMKIQQR